VLHSRREHVEHDRGVVQVEHDRVGEHRSLQVADPLLLD
jgi:hypothetical protein